MQETYEMRVDPWVRKIPWSMAQQPAPVFLPRESHGQGSLAGYSPGGHKELDMTEQLNKDKFHSSGEDKPSLVVIKYPC